MPAVRESINLNSIIIYWGIQFTPVSTTSCGVLVYTHCPNILHPGCTGIICIPPYNLFNYSLKKIPKDISYKFIKYPAAGCEITRSFFLDKKIYNLLHKTYKKSQELYKTLYNNYLSMGNFTELILYIYVTNNIEKKILNVFKFDFGIEKID